MSTETQFEQFTINRNGFPPLKFTGTLIGSSDDKTGTGTKTYVRIYRTKGGKIVCEVEHTTQWEGQKDHTKAVSVGTAKEAIEWLRDGEDRLGRISQSAVEKAAKADSEFADAFVEQVD